MEFVKKKLLIEIEYPINFDACWDAYGEATVFNEEVIWQLDKAKWDCVERITNLERKQNPTPMEIKEIEFLKVRLGVLKSVKVLPNDEARVVTTA